MGAGYSPGPPDGDVRKPATEAAVMDFQNEFNAVRDYLKDKNWSVPNRLSVDGKIGKNTINAFIVSEKLQGDLGKHWKMIVEESGLAGY